MVATEWTSRITERDLESRLRHVEVRAAELERIIESRCARLKAEIETQIVEDRTKALQAILVGLVIVLWVVVIASWLR
ncbi:MAG: hypothetical protein ACREME_10250 [Gemmatimonadales bacterium]